MTEYVGVPDGVRKCPVHKSWIKGQRIRLQGQGDVVKRYCEQCELAKPKDDAPPENKPKVRIGTL